MNKILFGLGLIFFILLIYGAHFLSTFSLFDDEIKVVKEFKVVKEIKVPNKNYLLLVYYVRSNAVTQSNLQVRKRENNIEEVISGFEKYNYLNDYKLMHLDTICLFISDTSNINPSIDEKKIKLP